MYKLAAIIGGVLLMAGVALAGTVSSLGSPSSPTIGQTIPTAAVTGTVRQEDRGLEQESADARGQEAEARGRANEAGEDVSGPCDEAEHANDPRCTGAATTPAAGDDDVADDNSGRGSSNSGPSERSGHGGGGDDSGHSGHGGDDD
jgi:hypothetical protein